MMSCTCSSTATRYFGMRKQVLQHLGVLDALLPFQEPGQAFHLATAGFKTLCQLQAPKASFALDLPQRERYLRLSAHLQELRAYLSAAE